jgi:TetR/AcrR family transcriptional regulator, tetracycline repressor protein
VTLPASGGRWQDELKEFGRSLLAVFRRHRGVAALTLGRVVVGSSMLEAMERSLAELRAAGMPDVVAVYVGDLFGLYVAAIAYEMDMTPADASGDFAAQVGGWLSSLPRDRFPNVTELAGTMVAGNADDRFEWGMDVIIRGLASYLDSPPTADARWPVAD